MKQRNVNHTVDKEIEGLVVSINCPLSCLLPWITIKICTCKGSQYEFRFRLSCLIWWLYILIQRSFNGNAILRLNNYLSSKAFIFNIIYLWWLYLVWMKHEEVDDVFVSCFINWLCWWWSFHVSGSPLTPWSFHVSDFYSVMSEGSVTDSVADNESQDGADGETDDEDRT